MVTLPPEFTATWYPGYFWNTKTKKLFTLKSGVLKEMKLTKPTIFNHGFLGYRVSHLGQRRNMWLKSLHMIKHMDSVIPVYTKIKKNDKTAPQGH
jgi:hypothetical protein